MCNSYIRLNNEFTGYLVPSSFLYLMSFSWSLCNNVWYSFQRPSIQFFSLYFENVLPPNQDPNLPATRELESNRDFLYQAASQSGARFASQTLSPQGWKTTTLVMGAAALAAASGLQGLEEWSLQRECPPHMYLRCCHVCMFLTCVHSPTYCCREFPLYDKGAVIFPSHCLGTFGLFSSLCF